MEVFGFQKFSKSLSVKLPDSRSFNVFWNFVPLGCRDSWALCACLHAPFLVEPHDYPKLPVQRFAPRSLQPVNPHLAKPAVRQRSNDAVAFGHGVSQYPECAEKLSIILRKACARIQCRHLRFDVWNLTLSHTAVPAPLAGTREPTQASRSAVQRLEQGSCASSLMTSVERELQARKGRGSCGGFAL